MGGGIVGEPDHSEDDVINDLDTKAKECLWYEQLQKFIPVQTLYSYSVPRIVCIGEESNGKSSTLERIAELSIFPTDRRLCTRMPIELRLRHQSKEEMSRLGHSSPYVMMKLIRGENSKLPEDQDDGPFTTADVATKVKEWMIAVVQAENGGAESGNAFGITDDRLIIELYSTRKISKCTKQFYSSCVTTSY